MGRAELAELVRSYISKEKVQKVYKFKNYAFIHLYERRDAEILMALLKHHFKNSCVEVRWANPSNALTDPHHRLLRVAKQINCPRSSTKKTEERESNRSDNSSNNTYVNHNPTTGHAHINFRSTFEPGSQVEICCDATISGAEFHYSHAVPSTSRSSPLHTSQQTAADTACSTRNEMIKLWMRNCEKPSEGPFHVGNGSRVFSYHGSRDDRDPNILRSQVDLSSRQTDPVEVFTDLYLMEMAKQMHTTNPHITLQDLLDALNKANEE